MKRKYYLGLGIIIIQLALALVIGWGFSDDIQIPTHWNMKGEVDGWTGKWSGILMFPGINLAILLFIIFMPVYSVRYRKSSDRFRKLMPDVALIMVTFFALIHLFSLLLAAGKVSADYQPITMLIGFLFIFLGNLLPKVPSNYFLGIRTPWTLSSEKNWRKTHRVGGVNFVMAGLVMIIMPFVLNNKADASTIAFVCAISLILLTVAFSFAYYLKHEKRGGN